MYKKVTVIGGGIAGMEIAGQLAFQGLEVTLLEKSNRLGGHVANWNHLFPDLEPANKIVSKLKFSIQDNVEILYSAEIHKLQQTNRNFSITLTDGQNIFADAIVIATGFDLFNASKKEEYGYGVYNNVITSAELEEIFNSGKPLKTDKGITPQRLAFIHCVGSRDEKAGNAYCSKICCITGIKQAIEVKKANPGAEIYCFYMDLRMYDRFFEDTYFEAQAKYGIHFIRGRLSEANENKDGMLILKAEDTLTGKPIKMQVDMMVLLVGFVSSKGTREIASKFELQLENDNFLKTADQHLNTGLTNREGIFIAGTCSGPKSVAETISHARSTALIVTDYLKKINNLAEINSEL